MRSDEMVVNAAASCVTKVDAGSCNFPTDHCKVPTKETMGAQNCNFASKFPQNGVFSALFCIFGRNFSNRLKFRRGELPHLPLRRWVNE